jgi:hypothetical protein
MRNYEKTTTKRQKNKKKTKWGAAARAEMRHLTL